MTLPSGRVRPVDLIAASVPDGPGPSRFARRATAQRRREAPTLTDLTRPAKARHEIEGVEGLVISSSWPTKCVVLLWVGRHDEIRAAFQARFSTSRHSNNC